MSPTVFAFSESFAVRLIRRVASSQNRLKSGGVIPDVIMIMDFRVLLDRGIGHPWIDKTFPSGLAKVQQILSRNAIIMDVAYPIWTGVPNISASDNRTSSLIYRH